MLVMGFKENIFVFLRKILLYDGFKLLRFCWEERGGKVLGGYCLFWENILELLVLGYYLKSVEGKICI